MLGHLSPKFLKFIAYAFVDPVNHFLSGIDFYLDLVSQLFK
eukprot:SAG31_NODE_784_length_12112_cov_10.538666_6_plen_41_part_00